MFDGHLDTVQDSERRLGEPQLWRGRQGARTRAPGTASGEAQGGSGVDSDGSRGSRSSRGLRGPFIPPRRVLRPEATTLTEAGGIARAGEDADICDAATAARGGTISSLPGSMLRRPFVPPRMVPSSSRPTQQQQQQHEAQVQQPQLHSRRALPGTPTHTGQLSPRQADIDPTALARADRLAAAAREMLLQSMSSGSESLPAPYANAQPLVCHDADTATSSPLGGHIQGGTVLQKAEGGPGPESLRRATSEVDGVAHEVRDAIYASMSLRLSTEQSLHPSAEQSLPASPRVLELPPLTLQLSPPMPAAPSGASPTSISGFRSSQQLPEQAAESPATSEIPGSCQPVGVVSQDGERVGQQPETPRIEAAAHGNDMGACQTDDRARDEARADSPVWTYPLTLELLSSSQSPPPKGASALLSSMGLPGTAPDVAVPLTLVLTSSTEPRCSSPSSEGGPAASSKAREPLACVPAPDVQLPAGGAVSKHAGGETGSEAGRAAVDAAQVHFAAASLDPVGAPATSAQPTCAIHSDSVSKERALHQGSEAAASAMHVRAEPAPLAFSPVWAPAQRMWLPAPSPLRGSPVPAPPARQPGDEHRASLATPAVAHPVTSPPLVIAETPSPVLSISQAAPATGGIFPTDLAAIAVAQSPHSAGARTPDSPYLRLGQTPPGSIIAGTPVTVPRTGGGLSVPSDRSGATDGAQPRAGRRSLMGPPPSRDRRLSSLLAHAAIGASRGAAADGGSGSPAEGDALGRGGGVAEEKLEPLEPLLGPGTAHLRRRPPTQACNIAHCTFIVSRVSCPVAVQVWYFSRPKCRSPGCHVMHTPPRQGEGYVAA